MSYSLLLLVSGVLPVTLGVAWMARAPLNPRDRVVRTTLLWVTARSAGPLNCVDSGHVGLVVLSVACGFDAVGCGEHSRARVDRLSRRFGAVVLRI